MILDNILFIIVQKLIPEKPYSWVVKFRFGEIEHEK